MLKLLNIQSAILLHSFANYPPECVVDCRYFQEPSGHESSKLALRFLEGRTDIDTHIRKKSLGKIDLPPDSAVLPRSK